MVSLLKIHALRALCLIPIYSSCKICLRNYLLKVFCTVPGYTKCPSSEIYHTIRVVSEGLLSTLNGGFLTTRALCVLPILEFRIQQDKQAELNPDRLPITQHFSVEPSPLNGTRESWRSGLEPPRRVWPSWRTWAMWLCVTLSTSEKDSILSCFVTYRLSREQPWLIFSSLSWWVSAQANHDFSRLTSCLNSVPTS